MSPREFLNGRIVLHPGDCMEILPALEAESADSVVTDPPYHLTSIVKRFGKSSEGKEAFATNNNHTGFRSLSRGFMGKQWDGGDIAFQPELWSEVLRVLKPGGHLLAFSGSRTYHRMACAIEDAGFEIRDQIMWLYSQGFPKGHAVDLSIWRMVLQCQLSASAPLVVQTSKPIRLLCAEGKGYIVAVSALILPGAERVWIIQIGEEGDLSGQMAMLSLDWIAEHTTWNIEWSCEASSVENLDPRNMSTTETNANATTDLKTWNSFQSATIRESIIRDATLADGSRWPVGIAETCSSGAESRLSAIPMLIALGNATSNPVKQWAGFNVALKPSHEPLVLARKPLIGTVAENVLAHRTGALNVDGCRIGVDDDERSIIDRRSGAGRSSSTGFLEEIGRDAGERFRSHNLGRWPANVIHDGSDEVEDAFAAFGESKSSDQVRVNRATAQFGFGDSKPQGRLSNGHSDTGTASRFFYTAKADSEDRLGSKHPTVKPLDLIQYLVRLITPPGGTVLDLFAGTGTTGEAAFREGMRAILIEREAEYQADIERRMDLVYASNKDRKVTADRVRNKVRVDRYRDTADLFGAEAAE